MAHRYAEVDRENLNNKLIKKPTLIKRPALDELSNNINIPRPTKDAILKNAKPDPQESKKPLTKSYSSTRIQNVPAASSKDESDPQMVSEYVEDIFRYLREQETQFPIREDFLEGHSSTPRMRAILVNWLCQVHSSFSLCLETLLMCISIIDRYLQVNKAVGKSDLQLVGVTALFIASKYEELYYPGMPDFVYVCDDTYKSRDVLAMEVKILCALDFSLGKPLSIHFLRRYSKLANAGNRLHDLSKYLIELALLDHKMSHVKPSLQAAAACCLSMAIMSNASCPSKVWTENLARATNWKYSEIKNVVVKFAKLLLAAESSKHQFIQQKYSEKKYNEISKNPKLKGSLVNKIAVAPIKG